MSTATNLTSYPSGGQPDRGGTLDMGATDRTRDFEKARRHSRHVRVLRIILPIVTVIVTGVYVVSVLRTAGVGDNLAAIALPRILPTDLAMQNPNYEGYSEGGSMYKVRADTARPDLKNTNLIQLSGITADLINAGRQKTTLTAKRGLYDSKKALLVLEDDIDVRGESGLKAQLSRATVFTKLKEIKSDDPVAVQFPAGSVRSDKMLFKQQQKHVVFSQNVRADLKPPSRKETATASKTTTPVNQMFVGSDKPVTITSATLDIFDADKRAIFKSNVVARQGGATLSAPELEASYDAGAPADTSQQTGAADSAAPGLLQGSGGKLRRIVAKGPVVMTQAPQDRVTCNAADFDAVNESAVLTGNVVMSSGASRSARSDRVDLDQRRERAVLTGNVVVTQDKNILKGRRLDVDQRNGITRLTSPAGVGYGAGQVSARFVQAGGKKPSAPKSQQTGAFRVDPNAPLDITASQLVVRDKIKTAVFSGNVKARQGAFRIAAAELHALYRGSAALGNVSSRGGAGGGGATTLTKIKAKNNVIITGTDGQQVSGDWADFDVAAGKGVVGGAVEVRQKGNVLHGTRLTIDTNTGRTIMDTAPRNTVAKPQGGGWTTTNDGQSGQTAAQANRGRPSAIFYLNDLENARRARKTAPKPSTGSAWQAQTSP